MRISFHGAARQVTGSCHLLETENGKHVLLDCGMIQGGKERHKLNRKRLKFASDLDCMILSHAHIDHSGRLPVLRREGYRGPIYATAATVELCRILLSDSGHIQEEDARWKIKRLKRKKEDWSWVTPLYTQKEALEVMQQFVPVEFDEPHEIDGIGKVTFRKAGHILGAAIVELELDNGGTQRTVTFSGDLGVDDARLMSRPQQVSCPDVLLIESTYGDRDREESGDRTELLYRIIERAFDRGGKVVIPSFAVGRTQEVLARINDIIASGRLKRLKTFVDSPMAIRATSVFRRHTDAYSESAQDLLEAGDEPLMFPGLEFARTVEESIAINECKESCVIISASGMCTAGRIKHHLKHNISNPKSTVLFVGYQAQGTLGREIQSGRSPVRIFGDHYPVKAAIEGIDGFSAHGDREELLAWFEGLGRVPKQTFVVHGEEDASLAFGATLEKKFSAKVTVPEMGQSYDID